MGGNPGSQSQFSTVATPSRIRKGPQGHFVCHQYHDLCPPSLFYFQRLSRDINLKKKKKQQQHTHLRKPNVSTYHKPRLQQCIQRMQPTKGTHHWLHNSQRAETHTCHPEEKEKNKAEFISGPINRAKKTKGEEGILGLGAGGGLQSSTGGVTKAPLAAQWKNAF